MRITVRVFICFLFLCASAYAQDITVLKKVLASPGPNLFYQNPSLALNEKNRLTLVVWERHPGNHPDHATLSRKISPQGVLKGSVRTLINGTNPYNPTVLYNKNRNEFALIYADEFVNPLHTIFIRPLTSQGAFKGAPVQVSTDTGSSFVNQHPFALFDDATRQYLLVWTRNSTTPGTTVAGEGILAAVLDERFNTIVGPAVIRGEDPVSHQNPQVRNVALHPSGKALIAFTEPVSANSTASHYYVAAFEQDLTGLLVTRVTKNPVDVAGLTAEFADLPSTFLIYFSDRRGIRKRKIDQTGKPTGTISSAFAPPLRSKPLLGPRFVATPESSGQTKGLLFAIEDPSQLAGNGKIWIQHIAGNGKPLGVPVEIDSDFISASDLEAVVLPSSTSTNLKLSVVYVNGAQITLPPQGEFSELIYLKLTVPVL